MADDNGTTVGQQILSSSAGALLTSVLVTPFDVVKVRLQAQARVQSGHRCFVLHTGIMDHLCICVQNGQPCHWYNKPPPPQLRGTWDGFFKIARNEGLPALWSGLPPTLVMSIPATVCYFTMYDKSKYYLQNHFFRTSWVPLIAGSIARTVVLTLVSPLEMIRTKMQSEKMSYFEISKAVRSATQQRGLIALYRGWTSTFLRDVPFSALYWFIYEEAKPFLAQSLNRGQDLLVWTVAGSFAGSIAAVVTLPFDVVKTHQQIEIGDNEAAGNYKKKPSSTLAVMKQVVRTGGVTSLFAGLTPRLLKVAPACAVMIGCYEYGKAYFRRKAHEHDTTVIDHR